MVSVVLLGITLGAFAGTVTQSLTVITADEQFVRANQLASDELETLRALSWEAVGFYTDDPGYTATAPSDGATTVTLGTSRPAGDPGLLPTQVISRDGIDYTVDVEIVWLDDPSSPPPPAVDPDPNDYKELRTRLTWSVQGRDFEVEQRSTRRPTVEEVEVAALPDCAPGEITEFSVSPEIIHLDDSGRTEEDVVVAVTTCSPSDTVTLAANPSATSTLQEQAGSDGTAWELRFDAGHGGFDPNFYDWEVTAYGPSGITSQTKLVQVVEFSVQPLEVTGLAISPDICTKTNGNVLRPSTLTATVAGAQSSDQVVFSWTADAGSTTASGATDLGGGTFEFVGTLPTTEDLDEATTSVSVAVTRVSEGLTVTRAFVVDVHKASNLSRCP